MVALVWTRSEPTLVYVWMVLLDATVKQILMSVNRHLVRMVRLAISMLILILAVALLDSAELTVKQTTKTVLKVLV